PPPPRGPESPTPWRPWILPPRGAELTRTGSRLELGGDQQTFGSKGAFGFQHPVRLYLPISKSQEYLQSSGEKVLASFPVQATIHFYNDESDGSDSEDEEQEGEIQPFHLQCPEEGSPEESGSEGRERLNHGSAGRAGIWGKGQFPHGDCPGGGECSSPK
ncbi:PREDICTED: protein ripply3, partial [Galeopterus variegatus]|uniref:Protein ripply3 n=1 Tax=Galeopterus variegatus TaxID=482537 RepID=A0ABM0S5X6_GALVR